MKKPAAAPKKKRKARAPSWAECSAWLQSQAEYRVKSNESAKAAGNDPFPLYTREIAIVLRLQRTVDFIETLGDQFTDLLKRNPKLVEQVMVRAPGYDDGEKEDHNDDDGADREIEGVGA